MSRTSSRTRAKLNLPLLALWVASVVVAVLGYVLMTSSNARQAALYTSQKGDYAQLFSAQSGSTVGGLLIAVGVLGVLLALAAQTVARKKAVAPEPVGVSDEELAFYPESAEPIEDAEASGPSEVQTEVQQPVEAAQRAEAPEPATTH